MTAVRHRWATALMVFLTCGCVTVVGVGSAWAAAAPERNMDAIAWTARGAPSVVSSDGVRLSIPRPTGRHPVGVRSTFVLDSARTEPTTGGPRAIPVRVWYPAKHRHGSSAPYFSAPVQAAIEQGIGVPTGLFNIDTHATLDAPARRHVRGVLLFTGGFSTPVALYTGLISELASRGYAVVAFDHPHETFVVEQPDGSLIPNDLQDDAGPGRDCSSPSACPVFEARLSDIGVVLGALDDLVQEARPRTPIGIFGHSNGGAAAAVAIRRHPQIQAGVNLDGFIPVELITAGLDQPFGLMLGLDQTPEELRDVEIFLSNMRAPHRLRSLDIRHYGFTDFVVFNAQAQRADPALGSALEATFPTGTLDSLRAGRRALMQQRRFLVRFFDRYLETNRGSGAGAARPYKVKDLQAISGPSPFAAGCPGAAFDDTNITGHELEPMITVNRANPRNIVATWKQDVGPNSTRADLVASSLDGGRTWTRSTLPGLTACTGGTADAGSDPWVSSDRGGTVYFSGLTAVFSVEATLTAIVSSHSDDGGRSWPSPATLAQHAPGNETPAITGSPTRAGEAYVVWADFAMSNVKFSRTTDGGASWTAPVVVDHAVGAAVFDLAPRLLVLPDGTLLTVFGRAYPEIGLAEGYAARSRDGGRTWAPAVRLLSQPVETFFDPEHPEEELPQPLFPSAAVAPDGSVYVAVERPTSASSGAIGVFKSRDGGLTWSSATLPGVSAYAFEPSIAVDSRGTVGITWYDLRNDRPGDERLTADVWFAYSRNGGASWRQTHVAGPTDLRTAPLARHNRVGEYQGLAALRGRGFAAAFTLAAPFAEDGPTDIFYASIRPGRCKHHRSC